MKIEAVIRPSALDDAKKVLNHEWISGLTVTEVKNRRSDGERSARYRGFESGHGLEPMLKVDVVVPDPLVPRVLHDLERWLRRGMEDDGKILVTRIEEAIQIRTGERGEAAL